MVHIDAGPTDCAWVARTLCGDDAESDSYPHNGRFRQHWEANIVGAVKWGDGYHGGMIRAVLASFSTLFGTDAGASLRNWCSSHGWPLLWSGCERAPHLHCFTANHSGSQNGKALRLLDLVVLPNTTVGSNLTFPRSNDTRSHDGLTQDQAWVRARAASTSTRSKIPFWDDLWGQMQLSIPSAFVTPLAPYQCGNADCVGIQSSELMITSDCVCDQR